MSLLEAPIWLYICPAIFYYGLCTFFGFIFFVLETSKFANIRQRAIVERLKCLNSQLASLKRWTFSSSPSFISSPYYYWAAFILLNRATVELAGEIEQFSCYWSPTITVLFLAYTTAQSYLAYIVFFIHKLPLAQKSIFFYALVELELLLFLFIHYCAKVVKGNRRIEHENGKFYLRFRHLGGFKRSACFRFIFKVRFC